MAGYKLTKTHVVSDKGEASIITGREGLAVPNADTYLTVGQVEKLTGIKETKLRHYDRIGLLTPARSGEGVANNRKLYGVDDLARLQAIVTLSVYQFSLEEIKVILDDETIDVEALIQTKIKALQRQEARLRSLILFTKFAKLSESDFIEGLANGPADLDDLADLMRDTHPYHHALQKLEAYSEQEAQAHLASLDSIINGLIMPPEVQGFAYLETIIDRFFCWWNDAVIPYEELGYLGFWAVFEDHGLIAEYIEAIGDAGDAGFLEMYAFFALIKRYLAEQSTTFAEIATLADEDIVLALEETYDLITITAIALFGTEGSREMTEVSCLEATSLLLSYAMGIIEDQKLAEYLDISADSNNLEQVLRVLDVMR